MEDSEAKACGVRGICLEPITLRKGKATISTCRGESSSCASFAVVNILELIGLPMDRTVPIKISKPIKYGVPAIHESDMRR